MFTSRLPIATSGRRPSDREASSNKLSLSRISNVPLAVKKANLFTPQDRKTFHGSATTGGKSFSSLSATAQKHQRPLKPMPERDVQITMFDELLDFLKENSYPFQLPEGKRFFSSISTTESARIFEFLISKVLPDFKVNRLEVDVPEGLNTLGYPFVRAVTKSALVSVTTRQAAVGLLVIFYWLVKLNLKFLTIFTDNGGLPDEEWQERKLVLTSVAPQEELIEQVIEQIDVETMQDVQQELNKANQNYEEQSQHVEFNAELVERMQAMREDIGKCVEYNAQLQSYLKTLQVESDEVDHDIKKRSIQSDEMVERIDMLRRLIRSHDMTNEEVEKLERRESTLISRSEAIKSKLIETTNTLEHNKAKLSRLNEKCETETTRIVASIEKSLELLETNLDLGLTQLASVEAELRNRLGILTELSDDPEQMARHTRDLKLFFDKLRLNIPALQSEILEVINERKDLFENRQKTIEKLQLEIARYEEKKKRRKRDNDNFTQHDIEKLSNLRGEREAFLRECFVNEKKYSQQVETTKAYLAQATKALTTAQHQRNETKRSTLDSLRSHIDLLKYKVTVDLERDTRSTEQWRNNRLVMEENLKIVQTGMKIAKNMSRKLKGNRPVSEKA